MKTSRLLRLPAVIEITGLGRDTIYRKAALIVDLAGLCLWLHSLDRGLW